MMVSASFERLASDNDLVLEEAFMSINRMKRQRAAKPIDTDPRLSTPRRNRNHQGRGKRKASFQGVQKISYESGIFTWVETTLNISDLLAGR